MSVSVFDIPSVVYMLTTVFNNAVYAKAVVTYTHVFQMKQGG